MAKTKSKSGGGPSSARPKVPLPSSSGGGNYFAQVVGELKKVIWPTRDELSRMTGIVIATVLIFSALIGTADLLLGKGAQAVYCSTGAQAAACPTPAPSPTRPPHKSTTSSGKSSPTPRADVATTHTPAPSAAVTPVH